MTKRKIPSLMFGIFLLSLAFLIVPQDVQGFEYFWNQSTVPDNYDYDIVVYKPFSDMTTATQFIDEANNGTTLNINYAAATENISGYFDRAMRVDGSSEGAEIAHANTFNINLNTLISVWVKKDASSNGVIFAQFGNLNVGVPHPTLGSGNGWAVMEDGIHFGMFKSGGDPAYRCDNAMLNDGEWHNYMYLLENTRVTTFRDGVVVTNTTNPATSCSVKSSNGNDNLNTLLGLVSSGTMRVGETNNVGTTLSNVSISEMSIFHGFSSPLILNGSALPEPIIPPEPPVLSSTQESALQIKSTLEGAGVGLAIILEWVASPLGVLIIGIFLVSGVTAVFTSVKLRMKTKK